MYLARSIYIVMMARRERRGGRGIALAAGRVKRIFTLDAMISFLFLSNLIKFK